MFPTIDGDAPSKQAMLTTFLSVASRLGLPEQSRDGTERISGHTLRATGAQGLARRGLDLWSIQLLGRWGSEAVRGYIREAQFDHAARAASAPAPK